MPVTGIGTLDSSLLNALSGIQTSQTLLSTTSRNITNAQTPGYVLKQQDAVSNFATGGVLAGPIKRFIDASLQQKLRTNIADTAFSQARQTVLTQMNQLSGDPAQGTSISAKINALAADFQELSANPQDAATAENILNAANDLAQTFNEQTVALQNLQTKANGDIVLDVNTVNTDLQQIATLNAQVLNAQANGKDPTDLQDARDVAVNDLSKLIGVNAFIDNQGVLQVLSADFKPLAGLYAEHVTYNQVTQSLSVSGATISNPNGQIGGNLQVLTTDTVQRLQNLSELATQLTLGFQNLATTSIQLSGTLANPSVAGPIAIPGTVNIVTDNGNTYQASLAYVGNPAGSSKWNLVATALAPVAPVNPDVPAPPTVTVPVGGYVLGTVDMSPSPPNAPTFSGQQVQLTPTVAGTQPGDIKALTGYTSGLSTGASAPTASFVNNTMTLFTQVSGALPPAGPYNPPYFSGNIELNPNISIAALAQGDAQSAAGANPTAGFAGVANSDAGAAQSAASMILNRLLNFQTTGLKQPAAQTLEQGSASLVVGVGQDLANANNKITDLTTANTQIQQAIAPNSEVNLDTEMAKLVVLQNLYQANARVVSTVSKLFDTLIALPT